MSGFGLVLNLVIFNWWIGFLRRMDTAFGLEHNTFRLSLSLKYRAHGFSSYSIGEMNSTMDTRRAVGRRSKYDMGTLFLLLGRRSFLAQ